MSKVFCAWLPLTIVLLAASAPGGAQPPEQAPGVIVSAAVEKPVADRVEALGTLRANESVTITANVTESISVIHFDDGQRVAAADILVEMTSEEEHALLEEAQARLSEAEGQYRRVKSLEAAGSASASLLDERRRDQSIARAVLSAIESRLADRLIKAPFDGVLGLRNISVGALVEPGDTITTLDDDRVMKLDFSVPSVFLPALQRGVGIEARSAALGDRIFSGEIASVDSRIDPVTRSVKVRALIDNPERLLKPGLLMQTELLRNPRQAVMIPEAALLQRGDEHSVMVIGAAADGGPVAEQRTVDIGLRRPGEVEITAGLAPGEQVITHGADKARSGQPVQIQAVDDGSQTMRELLAQPADGVGGPAERTP